MSNIKLVDLDPKNLRNAALDMYKALKSIEYVRINGFMVSPCCNHCAPGHIEGCIVEAALKKARGE